MEGPQPGSATCAQSPVKGDKSKKQKGRFIFRGHVGQRDPGLASRILACGGRVQIGRGALLGSLGNSLPTTDSLPSVPCRDIWLVVNFSPGGKFLP